jgi:hypothetical protein
VADYVPSRHDPLWEQCEGVSGRDIVPVVIGLEEGEELVVGSVTTGLSIERINGRCDRKPC